MAFQFLPITMNRGNATIAPINLTRIIACASEELGEPL
jgi:hypothetical protein